MAPKVDIDSTPKDHSLQTFIKGQCITLPKISFQCILKLYFSNKDLLVIRKKLLVHSISSIFIKTTFQLDFKKDTVKIGRNTTAILKKLRNGFMKTTWCQTKVNVTLCALEETLKTKHLFLKTK